MTTPAEMAHKRRIRIFFYFASIIILIILVNTPAPKFVLSSLLGDTVGVEIGQTLSGFSRDLFLLLLVSLYFEWARSRGVDESIDDTRSRLTILENTIRVYLPSSLRAAIGKELPVAEVLGVGLSRSLRTSKPTAMAAAQVSLGRASLEDVTVAVTLERQPSGHGPRVRSVMTASTDVKDVLVAVTKSPDQADLLASHSRELLSVISLGNDDGYDRAQRLSERYKISYRTGSGAFIDANLAQLARSTRRALVSLPEGIRESELSIFRAQLPEEVGRRTIRADFRYQLSTEGHFYVWRADRPMYVQQLSVEANDLALSNGRAVRFYVFLPDQEQIVVDTSSSRLSVHVDGWLLSGHGVIAMWEA